jgi:hypothetical protein
MIAERICILLAEYEPEILVVLIYVAICLVAW